jgi:hypothetical protein
MSIRPISGVLYTLAFLICAYPAFAQPVANADLESYQAVVGIPWAPAATVNVYEMNCCAPGQCNFSIYDRSVAKLAAKLTSVQINGAGGYSYRVAAGPFTFTTSGNREVDLYFACKEQ